MSRMGQSRRSDAGTTTSGLALINRHLRSPPACLKVPGELNNYAPGYTATTVRTRLNSCFDQGRCRSIISQMLSTIRIAPTTGLNPGLNLLRKEAVDEGFLFVERLIAD
jgi:hypothetical protein